MNPSDETVVPMRERLLQAASQLFYTEGFRAVSAERIIALVGTTKVTFYRHFPSKDELMVAYLERHAALERAVLGDVLELAQADPEAGLRLAVDALAAASCAPGYRGCAFINAAAEYADPAHPVRLVVLSHRRWLTAAFTRLLGTLGLADGAARDAAVELMILRDGVTVGGYLDDPAAVTRAFARAAAAVIAAHRTSASERNEIRA